MAQQIEEIRLRLAEAEAALKEREVTAKEASIAETQTKSVLNTAKAAHESSLAETDQQKEVRENVKTVSDIMNQSQE